MEAHIFRRNIQLHLIIYQACKVNKKLLVVIKIIACLLMICWALYTLRSLTLILTVIFCVCIFSFSNRKKHLITGITALLAFIIPFQPYAISFVSIDGGPKILSCCPGTPYRDYTGTLEKQKAGECKLCSDITTGFDPEYYLVW